jgi:hypothetical protein
VSSGGIGRHVHEDQPGWVTLPRLYFKGGSMSKSLSDVKWDPVNQEFRLQIDPLTAVIGPTDEGVYQSYLMLLPVILSNRKRIGACDEVEV